MNFQVTILKVLASYPNGIATLDALKRDLEFFASSGRDWSDRTRRLAAYLPGLSIFSMGLVERHPHGWQLTNKGQSALQFMEASDCGLQQDRAAERDVSRDTNIVEFAPHLRSRHVKGDTDANFFSTKTCLQSASPMFSAERQESQTASAI